MMLMMLPWLTKFHGEGALGSFNGAHGGHGVSLAGGPADLGAEHADEVVVGPVAGVGAEHVEVLELEGPAT